MLDKIKNNISILSFKLFDYKNKFSYTNSRTLFIRKFSLLFVSYALIIDIDAHTYMYEVKAIVCII